MQQLCRPSPMPSTGHCLKRHFWNSWGYVKFALRTLRVPFDLKHRGPTHTNKLTKDFVRRLVGQWLRTHLEGENLTTSAGTKIKSQALLGGVGVHLSIGASHWLELLPPLQVAVDPTFATDVNCWFGTRWFGRVP